MNFLRSILKISRKTLVGADHLGNKYFEAVQRNSAGEVVKTRRLVESSHKHYQYESGMIPHEWEAWVRGKRKKPPTEDEIFTREAMEQIVKKRAVEVDRRDQALQEKAYEEGLVAKPVQTKAAGHASSTTYQRIDSQSDPVSTGKEYEPAGWKPGGDSKK
ncbi:NADH dehydrogenase [ubiquinone] 1 alpha subcomplex assembly factor 2-like [Amphiura filiformis]|uniref:NADH dehydrogenase [ubiquinone] 1 alpha subcomplex assembly factor 2-like n=1 Tax=Amphiura filiformis TaxID=82378 RepID=UPI003B20E23A